MPTNYLNVLLFQLLFYFVNFCSSENFISINNIAFNSRGIYLYDSANNTITEDNVFFGNDEDISEGSKTFKTSGFELIIVFCAALFVIWKIKQE